MLPESPGAAPAVPFVPPVTRVQALRSAGATVEQVFNEGKVPLHHLARMGGVDGPVQAGRQLGSAYEIAKAGGRHAGWMKNARATMGARQLQHGIQTLTAQIELHRRWITDPASKQGVADCSPEDVARYVSEKWPRDIRRQEEQREILQELLKEMASGARSGSS